MKTTLLLIMLLTVPDLFAQEADLGIGVRLFQSRIITGDLAKMEVTVRNQGPDAATGVKLEMNVTQGLFSNLTTNAAGPCNVNSEAGQIICQNIGDFASGAQKVVLLRVQLEQQETPENLIIQSMVSSSISDPNMGNNTATTVFQVEPLPSIDNYALGMLTNMPESRKKRFERAARVLGAYCSGTNLHNGLDGLCDDLLQQAELGDFETLTRVLSWMRPRNVVHQARNSTKLVASQLSNVGQRIAQLRAGISGFSVADLELSNGSEVLPVSMLGYQNDDQAAASFVSPWGFFINGSLSAGDYQYADEINDGFDFDSDSLSAGVDYRFSNKFVLGSAIGYSQMSSQTGSGVTMESEGLSLNLFGLFTPSEKFYIDTRLSFARPEIKQTRKEFFELIDAIVDIEAIGRTDSEQMTAAVSAGYGYNFGAWQFSPYLGIEYVENQLDQFTETGANGFNLFYDDQDFESLRYNLGFNLSRAISTSKGVLSPQISWQYNREDQDGGIMAMRLIGMPVDELFNVETNFTENTSSQASIGLTWVMANGKMFYIRYQEVFGLRNFDQYSVSLGGRFEF